MNLEIQNLYKKTFIKDSELLKLAKYVYENYEDDELLTHHFVNAVSHRKYGANDVISADITDACICFKGENKEFVKLVKSPTAKKYFKNSTNTGDGYGHLTGIRDMFVELNKIYIIW